MELTKENFQTEVIDSDVPVLVDFWATWCGPCRAVAPIIDELAAEYEGKLKVGKVDVDAEQQLAGDFGVRSIPTLLIFNGGKLAEQLVGAVPKSELVDKLQGILEPAAA
ncbi:MAG: thioredoxin [Gemmatimonadetes bacterium]|jgi:thioredoxin 1|nr:thioredoxin [Gemmatimonadota bacterium]HCK09860.1 thioredoxin [Candidatus Latescibacterota bacterium]